MSSSRIPTCTRRSFLQAARRAIARRVSRAFRVSCIQSLWQYYSGSLCWFEYVSRRSTVWRAVVGCRRRKTAIRARFASLSLPNDEWASPRETQRRLSRVSQGTRKRKQAGRLGREKCAASAAAFNDCCSARWKCSLLTLLDSGQQCGSGARFVRSCCGIYTRCPRATFALTLRLSCPRLLPRNP